MTCRSSGWHAVVACGFLVACGTNVRDLLSEEAELTWQANSAIAAAEQQDPTLVAPVLVAEVEAAEAAKVEACAPVNDALQERMRGAEEEPDFTEEIYSDIEDLMVRMFPIGEIEDCADAHEDYRESVNALQGRLEELGVTP